MAIDTGAGSQDYRNLLDKVFNHYKPKHLLEFGLGMGTLYFLEKSDKVTSFEILVHPTQEGWTQEVLNYVGDNPNYKAIDFTHKDEFTEDLKSEIEKLLIEVKPDFVFVDSGCHCRGDIINLCFEHGIKNLSAHDTAHHAQLYGWDKIKAKEGYYFINHTEGQGTFFWTNDKDLYDNL